MFEVYRDKKIIYQWSRFNCLRSRGFVGFLEPSFGRSRAGRAGGQSGQGVRRVSGEFRGVLEPSWGAIAGRAGSEGRGAGGFKLAGLRTWREFIWQKG